MSIIPNPVQTDTFARYIGQTVRYEELIANNWTSIRRELTPAVFAYLVRARARVQQVQIELRPVAQLTQDEAIECFRLAFGRVNQRAIASHMLTEKTLTIVSNPIGKEADLELQISSNGIICGCMKGRNNEDEEVEFSQFINAVGVIDFLDSVGIALRGELENGLGAEKLVEQTEPENQ